MQLHVFLRKTFLFDQTNFIIFHHIMHHKNNTCNQQQQVYEVLGKKSFANIYSGITSCKKNLVGSEAEG